MTTDATALLEVPEAITQETNSKFEVRKLKGEFGDISYNFLVIDSPSKWSPAADFTGRYELDLGGQKLDIPLRGISYLEWEQQEEL